MKCGSSAQSSFTASGFSIAANTSTGTGGDGTAGTAFTALTILKPSDDCSIPLFILGSTGVTIPEVVLMKTDKKGTPALIVELENVQLVSSSLNGSGGETLELAYAAITITDGAGHTTGRIVRQPTGGPTSVLFTYLRSEVQLLVTN